jgi:hypothetical protein
MKVFFVGIHNKEDLMPLDILSKSGKIIHAIEKELGINAVKTNLYDIDRMPNATEAEREPIAWWYRNDVEAGDIVVLLGRMVHDDFHYAPGPIYIKLAHPASSLFRGGGSQNEYIKKAVGKIKEKLIKEQPKCENCNDVLKQQG